MLREELIDQFMCQSRLMPIDEQLKWLREAFDKMYWQGVTDSEATIKNK